MASEVAALLEHRLQSLILSNLILKADHSHSLARLDVFEHDAIIARELKRRGTQSPNDIKSVTKCILEELQDAHLPEEGGEDNRVPVVRV